MTPAESAAPFIPEWSLHPGAFLREHLKDIGMRQSELADRTGLTTKHINQIVTENIGISGDVAVRLELALGLPARFWTQLDADHAAFLAHERTWHELPRLLDWVRGFDAPTLRRHEVTGARDADQQVVEKVLSFFGVAGVEPFNATWMRPRVSFRRSQAFTVAEQNTALWLRLVDRCAASTQTAPFSLPALRRASRSIPGLTTLPITDGMLAARKILADAGVALVFVRQVPGTRVSAATWWVDARRPAVGLTERHKREDMLWFSLMHEIGHLLLHPRRETYLDLDEDKNEADGAEQQADRFAEDTLLPPGARKTVEQASSRQELAMLAASWGVGASVVAGCHGHLTGRWEIGGSLRRSISNEDVRDLEGMCQSEPLA